MAKVVGLLLLLGGIALVLLDLFVFNEPKAALRAGAVRVSLQGSQTLGAISIIGGVCTLLGLGALIGSRRR